MAYSSEYRGTASNVGAAKKKAASKTKTIATPGTKVSQATINKIKAMGMTKALKGAANASPEMREGLKRLYGAKRVGAAGGSSSPRYTSPDAARAGIKTSPKPTVKYGSADAARSATGTRNAPAKTADAARAAAMNKSNPSKLPYKAGFGATNMPYKTGSTGKAQNMPNTGAKKPGTTDPFAKFVFGAAKKLSGGSLNSTGGKTAAQVAASNAKRMGISVAEYNRRLNAKKNK